MQDATGRARVAQVALSNGAAGGRPKPKPAEPDAELVGRDVQVMLTSGKAYNGRLERVSTYMLALRTPQGAQLRIYKHATAWLLPL